LLLVSPLAYGLWLVACGWFSENGKRGSGNGLLFGLETGNGKRETGSESLWLVACGLMLVAGLAAACRLLLLQSSYN
jgi:hypothetical protein